MELLHDRGTASTTKARHLDGSAVERSRHLVYIRRSNNHYHFWRKVIPPNKSALPFKRWRLPPPRTYKSRENMHQKARALPPAYKSLKKMHTVSLANVAILCRQPPSRARTAVASRSKPHLAETRRAWSMHRCSLLSNPHAASSPELQLFFAGAPTSLRDTLAS